MHVDMGRYPVGGVQMKKAYDVFDENWREPWYRPILHWFDTCRLMIWLHRRFGKYCGHCGDYLGIRYKGNVCPSCYRDLKFSDEGDE